MIIVLVILICLLIVVLVSSAVYVFCEDNANKKQIEIEKVYSQKILNTQIGSNSQIAILKNQIKIEHEAFADYKTKFPMKAKYKNGTEVFVSILGRIQKGKIVAVCFTNATIEYSVDCSGVVLNGLREDQISRNEADLKN